MNQEILYTSAPKGLKPGSRGFCTVVSTAGMAKNLADRLESLSGYRHHHPPHQSHLNPVNYAHLLISVAGKRYHVLSRICDAGMDYTKRTNKLAHHVAFTVDEVAKAPGGPAKVMASADLFVEQWDEEVKTISASVRTLDQSTLAPAICGAWANAGVDPGWAGVLAESGVKKSLPMTVIFAPGTDTLSLVREATALVPKERRWDVTFSTYFTKLPAGVDCLWRMVLDGTDEAFALRRNPHARVIDLCDDQLGDAPPGELVQLARTGSANKPSPAAQAPLPVSSSGPSSAKFAESPEAQPKPVPRLLSEEAPVDSLPLIRPSMAGPKRSMRNGIAIGVLFLAMVAGMYGAYSAGRSRTLELSGDPIEPVPAEDVQPTQPVPEPEAADAVAEENPLNRLPDSVRQAIEDAQRENQQREAAAAQQRANTGDETGTTGSVEPQETEQAEPFDPQTHGAPFADLRRRERRLVLPDMYDTSTPEDQFEVIGEVFLHPSMHGQCDMQLYGPESIWHDDEFQCIKSIRKQEDNSSQPGKPYVHWKIENVFTGAVVPQRVAVGEFQILQNQLMFRWDPQWINRPSKQTSLQPCLIDLSVGNETETCTLIRPQKFAPLQIDFSQAVQYEHITPLGSSQPTIEIDFEHPKLSNMRISKSPIQRGETTIISFTNPHALGSKKDVVVELTFLDENPMGDFKLQVTAHQVTHVPPRGGFLSETRELRLARFRTVEQRFSLSGANNAAKAITSCQKALKEIEQSQKILEHLQEEVGERFEQRIENARKPEDKNKLRSQQQQFNKKWHQTKGELAKYKSHIEKYEKWIGEMIAFMDRIHNEARIHYRAYVEIQSHHLDIVSSR